MDIVGTNADDTLTGTSGDDYIQGLSGDDALFGLAGNDVLDGGPGVDSLAGGLGDDTYYVDVQSFYEVVTESAGEGIDTIHANINHRPYILPDNVENLVLDGHTARGTGNSLDNTIIGNAYRNVLDGRAGADVMVGGDGDDLYYVDNAGDVVQESAHQGCDSVLSSVSYSLGDQSIEWLGLTGSANINGTGNGLGNTIVGNAGNNVLDGKDGADVLSGAAGADTMIGGRGNDTYYVDNARDSVVEADNEGTDRVFSSVSYALRPFVENLTLTGTNKTNVNGNALNNTLVGNSRNNVFDGMAGADVMTGGAGSDTFGFTTSLVAGNVDTITDFNVADDKIRLTHTIFNTIAGIGALSADQFTANASGTAQDANDRIIYETDTGKLFYDSNGSAAGDSAQFAKLSPGLELSNANFFVI
jgi:Ca2+-binding RTX toxin-like protein